MATIDPSIALGVRPLQVENPMNQYATMSQIQNAQNQNALAQFQLASAKRAEESQNALSDVYRNAYDPSTGKVNNELLIRGLAERGAGHLIPKVQADILARQKEEAGLKKTTVETSGLEFKQKIEKANKAISDIAALNSPQDAIAGIDRHLANGDIDQAKADALKQSIAQARDFKTWQKTTLLNILDAKDRLVTEETSRHNLKTESISAGNLDVARQRLANEFNPELQANIAGAKKRAEENVKFETQGKVDVIANRKALQQAGYDPITGKDDITDLIKKSTGSYIGKGVDIGARLYGGATGGSQALAQLEQKGNAITFGILNGKLGAGISTSDRQFIESLVSRMSDGTLPVDDRLAAWNSAKNMMKTLGMVEESKSSNASNPNPTLNPSSSKSKPSLNEIFK